jgi:16S rRNA (guanine527-N7)-methyltransferase
MTDDRATGLAYIGANRQIEARLDKYVELLARWREVTNLMSESAFSHVWTRHLADSAQLLGYAPVARQWVDIGSGSGFPGMVIAILLAEVHGAEVHCVESNQKKCAFLRAVAQATAAPVRIHAARIELRDSCPLSAVDAVTSRALAPLPRLLQFANVWLMHGAVGIFPRGRSAGQIECFSVISEYRVESLRSKLDPDARILRVRIRPEAQK